MEEEKKQTELQKLRNEIGRNLTHLSDRKILEICDDYGISYDPSSIIQLRVFMLLVSAESIILELKK